MMSENLAATQTMQPVETLLDPARCLSAETNRPFVGQTDYEGEATLDAAMAAAREAVPEAQSAYKPSGKSTTSATLSMLAVTPLVLLLMLIVCGGLALGYAYLEEKFWQGSQSSSRGFGLLSILVDIVLVVLMFWIPSRTYAGIGKWLKNRNAKVPAVLAGIVTFLVAVVLFIPIWGGATLAPTNLTFVFIPVRWVLIIVGGLLVPLGVALSTYGRIAGQKYCEIKGVFLRPMRTVHVDFDFAENALALLKLGAYETVVRLPKPKDPKNKHFAEITLWWHEEAETAYVEMTMRFHGRSKPKKKKVTLEESKDKSAQWLVFSAELNRFQAQSVHAAYPA